MTIEYGRKRNAGGDVLAGREFVVGPIRLDCGRRDHKRLWLDCVFKTARMVRLVLEWLVRVTVG